MKADENNDGAISPIPSERDPLFALAQGLLLPLLAVGAAVLSIALPIAIPNQAHVSTLNQVAPPAGVNPPQGVAAPDVNVTGRVAVNVAAGPTLLCLLCLIVLLLLIIAIILLVEGVIRLISEIRRRLRKKKKSFWDWVAIILLIILVVILIVLILFLLYLLFYYVLPACVPMLIDCIAKLVAFNL